MWGIRQLFSISGSLTWSGYTRIWMQDVQIAYVLALWCFSRKGKRFIFYDTFCFPPLWERILISALYYSFLVRKAGLAPLSWDKLQRERRGRVKRGKEKKKVLTLMGQSIDYLTTRTQICPLFLHKESSY